MQLLPLPLITVYITKSIFAECLLEVHDNSIVLVSLVNHKQDQMSQRSNQYSLLDIDPVIVHHKSTKVGHLAMPTLTFTSMFV